MIKSNIKFLALSLLALVVSCEKETAIPVSEMRTVHYRVTVQAGTDTRATIEDDLKYKFEVGDRVYMQSDDGQLYGFLSLSFDDGIGKNVALFEGDLNYVGDFTPTLDTPVKLVLVGPEDNLHHISEGKVMELDPEDITPDSYKDKWTVSLPEAVRQLSHFTGSGVFGDNYFTLNQHSSFLVMSLSFNPETVSADTDITANLYNHFEDESKSSLGSVSCKTSDVDGDIEATWVFAFYPGTELSGAKLEVSVGSENVPALRMADATLQANTYYTFQRATYMMDYFTVEATVANTNTEITFNYAAASNGIQYSWDGYEWLNYTSSITLSAVGEKVYFRGKATSFKNTGTTPILTTGGKACYLSGDIMFLMCNEKYKPRTAIPTDFAFQGAFKGCTWLRLKEDKKLKLSASTLSRGCYAEMFSGCTELTSLTGLDFPSGEVALTPRCFDSMFLGCSKLAAIPEGFLPWTQLAFACYRKMFESCTILKDVPEKLLPATSLEKACYTRMFFNCTSLEVAPELPATEPAPACYFAIFRNCTKISYVKCLMLLTQEQRQAYQNPDKSKYSDEGDPPADNLENWDVISAWSVFNKWLVTTGNQPLNNQSTSHFVRNPEMTYPRTNSGNNWMSVVPSNWTMTPSQ